MSSNKEWYTEERCWISELSNSAVDPDLSIARARVTVGETTRWHYLIGTIERYLIEQGEGMVEVGDAPAYRVCVGDVVLIPAGVRQRIYNCGSSDLLFLALCTPRFLPENYVDCDPQPLD